MSSILLACLGAVMFVDLLNNLGNICSNFLSIDGDGRELVNKLNKGSNFFIIKTFILFQAFESTFKFSIFSNCLGKFVQITPQTTMDVGSSSGLEFHLICKVDNPHWTVVSHHNDVHEFSDSIIKES